MDKNPIGFMSYARSDDEHENGNLSAFRARLCGEVRIQSGDTSFDIFQDHIDIVWGQQWQQRLDAALDSVTLLIPIITPTFFNSDACRAEVARFALREQQLGRTDLIFPVYYISANVLDDKAKREKDAMAQVIASHQHMDWRELRHDPLTSPDAAKMLAKMAKQIVAAMERGSVAAVPVPQVEIIRSAPVMQLAPIAWLAPTVSGNPKPAWASAVGADEFGDWAEISVNNVVQRLRWVAAGDFLMGSPKDEAGRRANEGPQHRVTISRGLWLADTACTQALWQAVMGGNPSKFHENNRGGPQHPVEKMSWDMIQPFLQAMTAKLPGCQVTLPTEAEWEYACRAGSETAFSFGETISPEQINFNGNFPCGKGKKGENRERTLPVKDLPANKWGLYQMHGNVFEWCADGGRIYEDKAIADPGLAEAVTLAGAGSALRVVRGGGWNGDAQGARSAYCGSNRPGRRNDNAGFRLALRPQSQTSGI
jgi:formylglycine-generating enzyme required for sulfatase activity